MSKDAEFRVKIMTPEKIIFEGNVLFLNVPGEEGSLGILAHHPAFISTLVPGKITIGRKEDKDQVVLRSSSAGFVGVGGNSVVILLDSFQTGTVGNKDPGYSRL